jgi:serine/threonine protein kinase/tetratricopeptide (TPR) repeat protein
MTDPQSAPASPDPSATSFEDLLVGALDRLEAEGPAGLERWLAAHPAAAPRLRQHIERLHHIGLAGDGAVGGEAHPERMGDFRILGPIGQGGMGVVYRAVQESLGREVALKLIRPDQLFFPGARDRFRREVELVARMQHPGIVPVYAVGSEGGVPYFAMELVRGVSLADLIERLAARGADTIDGATLAAAIADATGEAVSDGGAGLFAGDWNEVVLRIVREVAEALEHAHRRGVLHRDVKPSNVMLTRDGRVLLLDFGLAGGDASQRLTRSGSPLGSLAYMPPEVLAGQTGRDARCDVYSLGVTAWELLALRLPYQDSDPVKMRELAGTAARPPLATCNRAVTWEIETVVATAMDPDPARRYASASAFARDLDNVLGKRPIEAREASPWLRLRRWSQRHPARAVALVAAVVVAVGGPSLWALQESQVRVRIEAQRDELRTTNVALDAAKATAEAESARARSNFAKLQLAVDTMLTKVGDESLRDIPRMELVRRDLLTGALRFYEGFLAEQPDDPALRLEAAHVRLRTAEVHALLGDHRGAGEEVGRALAAFAAEPALDAAAQLEVARAKSRLATARRLLGDLPGAGEASAAALAAWQQLPEQVEVVRGRGEAQVEASLVAADRGDLAAALGGLEAAIVAVTDWRARQGETAPLAGLEARMLHRAAVWAFQSGLQQRSRQAGGPLVERAIDFHRRAQTLWAAAADRDEPTVQSERAHGGVNLALALQRLGRFDEACETLAAAVPLLERLATDFPHSQRRRSELANARVNYAASLGQIDRSEECGRQLELGMATWRGLVAESPANDDFMIGLAHTLQSRAVLAFYAGDTEQAGVLYGEAAETTDRALAVRPDNPTYRRVRRKLWECMAELGLQTKQHGPAAFAARQLLDQKLAPIEPLLAGALIARCIPLAEGEVAAGYREEARALLQAEINRGVTVADWRKNPTLGGQWDKPGFQELADELSRAGG